MKRTVKLSNGFTLIELIVVMVVLSFVGAIVVAILVSTLRGSQKTTTLTEVRQSGNYAISIMGRMIRNNQRVNSCTSNNINITNPDGGQTVFSCSPSTIASNGASFFPATVSISSCIISCVQVATGFAQTVTISFTAQSDNASSGWQQVSIPFTTSVQTRNY